jgi:hypothetical protein
MFIDIFVCCTTYKKRRVNDVIESADGAMRSDECQMVEAGSPLGVPYKLGV